MDVAESKGTQGKRTPKNQLNFIALLRREGCSVQLIMQRLNEVFGADARGLRTVQNYVKDIDENRIPWNRFNTDGDDANLIFEVLGEVIKHSDGARVSFTQEEADTVLWVQKSAPDLPPYFVWLTAVFYMTEIRRKPLDAQDFSPMDMFLALKPWRSLDAMFDFDNRYQSGQIAEGHSIMEVARFARERVYARESEEDMAELIRLAREGDSQAIMVLSMEENWRNQNFEDPVLEVASEMPPAEELERMVNEESE